MRRVSDEALLRLDVFFHSLKHFVKSVNQWLKLFRDTPGGDGGEIRRIACLNGLAQAG